MTDPAHVPWKADDPLVTVTVTVSEPDVLSVRMFGVDYPTPPEWGSLTRASFGKLMDHLYRRLGQPFTVEVIETDGSRHTGIIDLPAGQPQPPTGGAVPRRMLRELLPTPVTPVEQAGGAKAVEEPVEEAMEPTVDLAAAQVTGGGFQSGEQIAVTVVLGTVTADQSGKADVPVAGWLKTGVLLLGRDSGHIAHVACGR